MEQTFSLIFRRCRRPLAAALIFSLLFCGCGSPTPAERLTGHWHGTYRSGRVSASSDWQFNHDGTETASLSLPQGVLTAQGTWTLRHGTLTQRTTSRAIISGGQQKKILLANPMEAAYQCVLTGDTLTMTRAGTQETIVLTRSTGENP